MKSILKIFVALLAVVSAVSCKDNGREGKVPSLGAPYELILVANQSIRESGLGDTLIKILSAPMPMFNNFEPRLSVMRIMPNNFKDMMTKQRNILIVNTGDRYAEPSMVAQYNVYAAPQIVVSVTGPDIESLTAYVGEHSVELQAIFDIAERNRALELNKRYGEKILEQRIEEKFGFKMHLNKGWLIANDKPEDFMWLRYEYQLASQGIFIYTYPYEGRDNFTLDWLIANRNKFAALIPAENPGSFMTTSPFIEPRLRHLRINGRYWAEMRGFWDTEGDFMGGPFINYSTLDTENRRVVSIDMFVFSPDKPKRNYVKQLENLIYSVSFKGDEKASESAE